ncbi:hypothetical protein ABG768_000566 [Culter alburnus]|uniref:Uncharacterized protein n=1 Tax=Culter alburnus TaxID=194366 RepID=A0AAW2B7H3_CULAL
MTRAQRAERLRETNEQSSAQSGNYEESEEEDLYPLPQLTSQRTGLWDRPIESENALPAPSDTPIVTVEGPPVPDVSEEEDEQEELVQSGETENPLSPVPEPVVDTELEEGDVLVSSVLDNKSICEPKEHRKVKPVINLSYDELGKPTDRPITIILYV